MRDLDNVPGNDDANNAVVDSPKTQSLEHTDRAALVPQRGSADERTELYTRLRTIIETATESIRTLKEENATLATQNTAMLDRIGTLEYRIRAVTVDLANDELALRRSADVLEQVLQSPPVAASQEPDAPPTPLHMSEPERAPHAVDPSAETGPIEMAPREEMPAAMAEQSTTDEPAVVDEPEPPVAPTASYGGDMAEPSVPTARAASHEKGSYTLIAYPFVRFSDLGQFQAALQKLAGVHDVQVRRFAQGTLEMRIGYTGSTDLATTLRTLATEVEDVQEEDPNRLRVRLRTSQDT